MAAARAVPAPRREAWERVTTVPLVVLGVGYIFAYTIYVLAPWIPRGPGSPLFITLIAAWLVFVVDVVVRISLTPRGGRWAFARTHPIDVLSALIPLFRAFRVLALLREIPYLQRRSGDAVRANIIIYAATYAAVFVYFIALATLQAERDAAGATITTFGDAVWWAIVTIATVGYGDMYPVTTEGRFYAVFLMAGGVVIVGTASATVISYIGDKVRTVRGTGQGGDTAAIIEGLSAPDAADEPSANGAGTDGRRTGADGADGRSADDG
ncbi:potassium channel family protein [Agromyces sp. PvR057]|uniref:potassium channel family protein n=1 Tax=Agromyces sp. PvR057 TaxID=3156403 RepID=UPI000E277DB6